MDDLFFLRQAIEVAANARRHGNHPFGAVLVDASGQVLLTAENTVVTERDCTGHAETNLMRIASQRHTPEELAACTLYASTEPCPMCAGAIFWGGLGRVVYALSETQLYSLTGATPNKLPLGCRDVLAHGGRSVEVAGPQIEDEARVVHDGFWS